MNSRRRFCAIDIRRVTLSVIGGLLVCAAPLQSAAAQSFLVCERSELLKPSRAANSGWVTDGEEILHAFAGDDLSAFFGFLPRIQIVERAAPNAYAIKPGGIVVSSGLIDITDSSSEFAFIIAHELGHLLLERGAAVHTFAAVQAGIDERLAHEFAADAYAVRLLADRGFDRTAGVTILKKVIAATERAGGAADALFPSMESRIAAMSRNLSEPRVY